MKSIRVLETVGKATGVLATSALILSVIYDWGFFFALDIGFIDVPTSIGDHIRSGLIWLPTTLLCFFIIVAIEFINKRIERGLTEEEIIKSSKKPERLRKFRQWPLMLFRIIFIVIVAGFLLIGDLYSGRGLLPIALIVTWSMFSKWANNTPLIQMRRSETVRELFHWMPMLFFFIFFLGYNKATDLLADNTPHFKLVLNRVEQPLEVNVLRHIEKGTLVVKTKTKKISFFTWTEVSGLEATEPYKPYLGLFGRLISERRKNVSNKQMKRTK